MKKRHSYFSVVLIILLFIPVIPILAQEQENTTFIITRHAERLDDSDDSSLSDIGKERAVRLADHLERAEITAIYSTPYKRTEETVTVLTGNKNLEIGFFDSFDEETLTHLFETYIGGTIVVAGHSNTVPHIVNILIGEERFEDFDTSDYDNLFIITLDEMGDGKMVHLVY